MKKITKADILFVVTLLLILILHIFFLFLVPTLVDESFYAVIPFRLVNGDSLIQDEWNLTQFSSLFSYLPVWLWTTIKDSAEGIIFFLRCTYLLIHTTIAVVIYGFFRKYKNWAIMASAMFYIHIPYRTQAISYHSMFIVFLLLLSLCLISIYEKKSTKLYILAGICFGCCCVCNPLLCLVFPLLLIICILWARRQDISIKIKNYQATRNGEKLTNREKKKQKKQMKEFSPLDNYNCFFAKDAFKGFSIGLLILAVIAVLFFFLTGGTISSIGDNLKNLLGNSNYEIASLDLFSKLSNTIQHFHNYSLGMSFIVPALFVALFFDKKRKDNTHRFIYLLVSIIWSVIFMIGCLTDDSYIIFATSLPFCVTSGVCYLLTENKNKTLFNCMFIPCLIATFFHLLAANTHLPAMGVVLAVNNVAGVFFIMDLFKEIRTAPKEQTEPANDKIFSILCCSAIIIIFSVQILFYVLAYQYKQLPYKDAVQATTGPYAGLYMNEEKYEDYQKKVDDVNYIKDISWESEPVYLVTYNNWMYLHLDRPIAVDSAWYTGHLDEERLFEYYKENPDKIPEYIYIESSSFNDSRIQILSKMFEFTQEKLSNGVLLNVERCKF